MRRWFVRILVVLVLLALVGAIAVEYVLRSDLPRDIIADGIASETGLITHIDELRASWGGHTVVRGLTLTLPYAREPMVRIPSLELEHTGLLMILISGFEVESADVSGMRVRLVEDETGRWNAQRAIGLMANAEASEPTDESDAPLALPSVEVSDLKLTVNPAEGEAATVGPIEFVGEPGQGDGWAFEGRVASSAAQAAKGAPERADAWVRLAGRVQTRGDFQHHVELAVDRPEREPIVRAFAAGLPEPVRVNLTWDGRIEGDGAGGRLEVRDTRVGDWRASGPVEITAEGGQVSVEPDGLSVASLRDEGTGVDLLGGRVVAGDAIRAERLEVRGFQTLATVNASWSPAEGRGEVEAAWNGLVSDDQRTRHEGTLHASYSQPTPGGHRLEARVESTGRSPSGGWDAVVEANAGGPSAERLNWRVNLPRARMPRPDQPTIVLDGTSVTGALEGPLVKLTGATLPEAENLTAAAQYDTDTQAWSVNLDLPRWTLPGGADLGPLSLAARAEGDTRRVNLKELAVRAMDARLSASGRYEAERTTPLDLRVDASWTGGMIAEAENGAAADEKELVFYSDPPSSAEPSEAEALIGRVAWSGRVRGAVSPLDLSVEGPLTAERLRINGQPLRPIRTAIHLRATDERATLRIDPFELLGGRIAVDGSALLGEGERNAEVAVRVEELSLGQAAALSGQPLEVKGAMSSDVKVSLPGLAADQFQVSGSWSVRDLAADPLRVDRASGELRTRGRTLRLDPITLQKDGGRAEGRFWYNLQDGRTSRAELNVNDWPLRVDEAGLKTAVAGDLYVDLDLVGRRVRGRGELNMDLAFEGFEPLGPVTLRGEVGENVITLERIDAAVLDGGLEGTASLRLDDPYQSTAKLTWNDLDLAALNQFIPSGEPERAAQGGLSWAYPSAAPPVSSHADASGGNAGAATASAPASSQDARRGGEEDAAPPAPPMLAGRVDGSLELGPTTDEPRPFEPSRLTLHVQPTDAAVRGVELTGLDATVYAGPRRIMIQDSSVKVAGGAVSPWASITKHNGQWYGQAQADFEQLDIAKLNPAPEPMPGRLAGELSFVGPLDRIELLSGSGRIDISESDLVNLDVIGGLFQAMGVQFDEPDPTGEGQVELRLDGGNLYVDRLNYFNRGVDAFGAGRIEGIFNWGENPIHLTVGGTIRPLKNLNLPVVEEFDRALSTAQSSLTTVRVSGTVQDYKVEQVSLGKIGGTLDRLFSGESDPDQ